MEKTRNNIVVIGAGYGGITAALKLAKLFRRRPDYQVHLVDKSPYHVLKTRLHEAAVRKIEIAIPIERLIRNRNIIFHRAEVTRIDPDGRLVYLRDESLPFTYLVLALGSQTNFYGIPGLREHAFTLESLADARRIRDHISRLCGQSSAETDENRRRRMLRFVVGGGGLTGVEFAAELAAFAAECAHGHRVNPQEIELIIIEAGNRIVPYLEERVAASIQEKLVAKGVRIMTGTKIVSMKEGSVTLSTGPVLETGTLVWMGGIRVSDMISESSMKIGPLGRVLVDKYLSATGYPHIYAIGDNALAMDPKTGKPIPAAAQFALQQGRLVPDNIYADVTGGARKPYRMKFWGEFISLGRHLAAGWLALPLGGKITFAGFLGSLLRAVIEEKHILLLRKESRDWMS